MIPRTRNNMSSFDCISALQKCIRRGLEREAMHFAMEMCMSSKAFYTRTLNRLIVIAHEDIGLADRDAVTFAMVNILAIRDRYDAEKPGKYGLALGSVIRVLCRAKKSRVGDWFGIIAIQNVRSGIQPRIEDWMLDMHTQRGKAMGRGLDHFLSEGCKLYPEPEHPELYEDEAIKLLRVAHGEEPALL